MIKPNLARRLTHQGISLIVILTISTTTLITIAVTTRFTNPLMFIVSQLAESGGHFSSVKPSETLYLVSLVQPCDYHAGLCGDEIGRIRVLNLSTREFARTIETGYKPDLALSPDGQRLYLAAIRGQDPTSWEDNLTAFNTSTWQTLWKTQIEHRPGENCRVVYQDVGPSALALSPDGNRLFVYKYAGHDDWFTVVDTATGKPVGDSAHLSNCDVADLHFSPDDQWLYLSCYGSNDVRFMNAKTLQVEGTLTIPGAPFSDYPGVPPYTKIGGMPGSMVSTYLSLDGRWLYVVSDEPRLALVNVEKRSIERWVDLGRQNYPAVSLGSVALSADGSLLYVGIRTKGEDEPVDEIHVFDTHSWQPRTRLPLEGLHLDGDLKLLSVSRMNNELLVGLESEFLQSNFLHQRSTFLILDPARPGILPSPKLDLGEGESLVRIITAP